MENPKIDDVVSVTFPNGREIRLTLVKLDKPFAGTDAKDMVSLDEYLGAPPLFNISN